MKNLLYLIAILFSFSALAQESASFKYLLRNPEVREFYIDPTSGNVLLLSDDEFVILDRKSGDAILNKELVDKIGKHQSFITKEKTDEGSFVNNIHLDEGSGFLIFHEAGIAILLDWNSTTNAIAAYKMADGSLLWVSEDFQYAKSLLQSLAEAAVLTGANKLNAMTPLSGDIATDFILYDMGAGTRSVYWYTMSLGAAAFLTPIEGRAEFLIKDGKDQVLIEAATGKEKWRYSKFNMTIAFSKLLSERNELLLVHNNPSFVGEGANKLITVLLDMETGEENLRIVPESAFSDDQVQIIDNKLVFGLKGLEVYDLTDGSRVLNTLGWKDQKASKSTAFGKFMASQESAVPAPTTFIGSLYEDSFVYTGFLKDVTGTYLNPLSPGMTTKATIAKYQVQGMKEDQKPVWQEKIASYVSGLIQLENELVATRQPNIGKESWVIVDKNSGKVKKELKFSSGGVYINPIISETQIFHALKKSFVIIDRSSWKVSKEVDLKNLKIGRTYYLRKAEDQFVVVGKEGVSWISSGGSIEKSFSLRKNKGIQVTDENAILFDESTAYLISFGDQQVREIVKGSPLLPDTQLLYSPEAKFLLRITKNRVYGYNF